MRRGRRLRGADVGRLRRLPPGNRRGPARLDADHRRQPARDGPIEPAQRLSAMYDAFNERDMDTAMGQMAPDVDWPKAWEPGRARGRDGLRDYWGRMWASVDATVQPLGFACRADGTIAVEVRRVVRDLDGRLLERQRALHVYVMRDDLVSRMDVEELSDCA